MTTKRGRPPGSGFNIAPAKVLALQNQGLTYQAIADELGISLSLVSELLSKARTEPNDPTIEGRLERFIQAVQTRNPRAMGLLDQWEPGEISAQVLDRSGMAPLRFNGVLIREGSTQFLGTTEEKPNEDYWTVKIFSVLPAESDGPKYAIGITYVTTPRKAVTLATHEAALTDNPGKILEEYDPLEVLRGFPDDPKFASRQKYLEQHSEATWDQMVSALLRDPL